MVKWTDMRRTGGDARAGRAPSRSFARRIGAAAIVALMPVGAWALGRLALSLAAESAQPGVGPEAFIAPVVVGIGAVACAYLTLSALAMIASAITGVVPRAVAALAPHAWRRLVATAAGLTLSAGIAVPAVATDAGPGWTGQVSATATDASPGWASSPFGSGSGQTPATDYAPGWTPTETAVAVSHAGGTTEDSRTATAPEAGDDALATVTVAAGDTLWDLTAELTEGSDAQIASRWPLLYRANREVIGADPDAIVPGQVLTVPTEFTR